MRIAYITNSALESTSANATQVFNSARELMRMGHRVTLYCTSRQSKKLLVKGSLGDRLAQLDPKESIKVVQSNWSRMKARSGVFSLGVVLRILHSDYELIICRDIGSMFLLSFTSKPVVYEVHDFPTLQQIFKRILVSVAIRVQEVRFRLGCQSLIYVFISEALRNAYSRVFPLHKQVYLTVPSTVTPLLPLRRKEVRHRKSKFQDRLKIVYAGALRPEKGIDLVIHLASQLPDLEFTLLGDPAELESSYRRRLAGLRNITLLGYVNHDHIHPLISDADIALLPNACPPTQTERDILQINRWTSPLKVFDYLAAGVAICYSDIPVLNEILTDGVTGVACKCNDFNDWKVKVSNLRYEDDQRKQLGYSARQLFEEKYVLNKRCEKLITVHKLTTVQRAVNEE